jgi:hypothetical protein
MYTGKRYLELLVGIEAYFFNKQADYWKTISIHGTFLKGKAALSLQVAEDAISQIKRIDYKIRSL